MAGKGDLVYGVGSKLISGAMPGGYANKPNSVKIGGNPYEARPIHEIEQASRDYARQAGMPDPTIGGFSEFDEDRATAIANAFEMMIHDPQNPTVLQSYEAMIEETMGQYEALRDAGIDFKFLKDGMADPYAASPAMGYQDLVENGRLYVFPTLGDDGGFGTLNDIQDNPLLKNVGRVGDLDNATANDAFRAVHDAYGHFGPGNPFFRHKGEERAWEAHSRMYSDEALPAMTTETRGQNSWVNFGPYGEKNRTASGADTIFADQKVGILPKWAYTSPLFAVAMGIANQQGAGQGQVADWDGF